MIKKAAVQKLFKKLPSAPGIYKMLNKEGTILYIGKAKDLKKRVKQYFQKNYQHSTRTKKLLEKADNIEFTTVDSELEAIILETNLIKQVLPKYNILMKDDKNYVYIKITNETFPKIQIVREVKKDHAKYFGPKTAANKVKETFKILKKLFPFRHCNLCIDKNFKITNKTIKYPCLDYHIKRCIAPCIGKCTPQEYEQIIKNVENFLKGNANQILRDLNQEMKELAQNKQFEKAAKMRDKTEKAKQILERQKISDPNQKDKDIINYTIAFERAYFNLFQVRDGKLIGQENFILSAKELEDDQENPEVLEAFLRQYYEIATDIPKEILIPHKIENQKEIKSKIIIPKIGDKNKLLGMSKKNAQIFADRNKPSWQEESKITENAIKELQKIIKLKNPPKRIECYDISHLNGTDTVGSMVVFQNGVPKPKLYRRFKLKTTVNTPNDVKSMEEVLYRRFSKISIDIVSKDYEFKKALKRHQELVEKNAKPTIKKYKLKYKDFYVIEKNKKAHGLITALEINKNISLFQALWVSPKERGKKLGHKLLKNMIIKAKSNRIYLFCKHELKDYYLRIGFEEIMKIPEELKKHSNKNSLALAYDKTKHKKDESFEKIPDLVIVDGGKPQLGSAQKIFQELNIKIPLLSIAKKEEELFLPKEKTSIKLEKNNEALKLIQRARDESHRFAISYNKKLRSKRFKTQ
jgi:excinuclease ABC subunit C